MSLSKQINYQISGNEQGKKLVFLHGVMGSLSNWSRVKSVFEADYQVLVLDQRGHGHSFHPTTPYTYENYAGDLHGLLSELGWDKVRLVGHSMGARVALVFCDLYPEMVEKVVIEDITPGTNSVASSAIERWISGVPVPFASRAAAKEFLFGPFQRQFSSVKEATAMSNFFYMNLTETAAGMTWRFSLQGILQTIEEGKRVDRWREWENLKMPVLVLRGESSVDLPRADFQRMLATNAMATGQEVAGSGHWIHFDQPEAFKQLTKNFLDASAK